MENDINGKCETENYSFGTDETYVRIRRRGERSDEVFLIPKAEFGKALVGLGIVQIATVQFQKVADTNEPGNAVDTKAVEAELASRGKSHRKV